MARAAGVLKDRHRDGDPVSGAQWRENYGNLAYHYDQGRRVLWDDVFVTGAGTDPTKHNDNHDWSNIECIYALTPAIELTPNYVRGRLRPPELYAKVRAKVGPGLETPTAHVRLYAIPTLTTLLSWNEIHDDPASWLALSYCQWDLSSQFYPATPGWLSEEKIERAAFTEESLTYPDPATGLPTDITVWMCHLVLCGLGDGTANSGAVIAAIQVWEEGPGDG